MTSREIVRRALRFESPSRLPFDLPEPYGSDFYSIGISPSPDDRPRQGVDEWGCVWSNMGTTRLGEVKEYALKTWEDFHRLPIPDISLPHRWAHLQGAREKAGDKYLLSNGISIYERAHFLRGLEELWVDIYEHPRELEKLLDVLVELNLQAIKGYAALGADGYIFCDDWGLQNTLMIHPMKWREFWKPRYHRIFQAAHAHGMDTFLHSCGYITDILDDLIEAGLDVIHMDQQENMGLEELGRRFAGRLTFYSPVDIQRTMASNDLDAIRAYCHRMKDCLATSQGGFIPRWYTDPVSAGHTPEAIEAMCQEFIGLL